MLLEILILLPLIGSFFILFVPKENLVLIRNTALNFSLLTFLVSVFLWIGFDSFVSKFQFITKVLLRKFTLLDENLVEDGIFRLKGTIWQLCVKFVNLKYIYYL